MSLREAKPRDFWSRRRAKVEAEERVEIETQEREALAAVEAEKSDEDLLEELGLPDPESLKQGDDFSVFMSKMVPDRLRRRALRVLWRSNPVLACLDDLVDYADDYTDAATVVENLQTSYQVGKGMLYHIEKVAELAAKADDTPDIAPEDDAADIEAPDALALAPQEPEPEHAQSDEIEDHEIGMMPARRMQFSFDTSDTRPSA